MCFVWVDTLAVPWWKL